MSHAPVMLTEAIEALNIRAGGVYVDATFGAGGYSRAILQAAEVRVLGLDRDPGAEPAAAEVAASSAGRFEFRRAPFSEMESAAHAIGCDQVDGVVLDVGVSSMQLDDPARGFSFRHDGPLDMRMGRDGPSAADLVNEASEGELIAILRAYGEERRARRIVLAILAARADAPIDTTGRLAKIVENAIGRGDGRIHPATRTFQALRIAVNDELGELARALSAAERLLASGGRLVAVTFHSLEDRLVKTFLRLRAGRAPGGSRHAPQAAPGAPPSFALSPGQPRAPSQDEIAANPRARSAKLRVGERTNAPPWGDDSHYPRPLRTGARS